MEYLGYTYNKPSKGKNQKWNPIIVEFNSSDEFNEATSKMMNILYKENSDGKCIVLDGKGNNYYLEIIHSTFDTVNNTIKVFPFDCRTMEARPKIQEKKATESKPA